jgi:mRNA interferase RelE/StbE
VKYRLIYTQRAARDIAGLDPKTKERIGKTLLRYKEEPLRYAEKLSEHILGTYRFRIGDYRVIFDL